MTFLLPLLLALAGPSSAAGSHGCPPEHRNAELRVQNLLGSPLIVEMRSCYDLGTASADDIRRLTNERDRDTCKALWNAVQTSGTSLSPGDRVTFFRSGDRFFVPVTRLHRPASPGVLQLDGFSSLDVYDSAYTLIGRFGA